MRNNTPPGQQHGRIPLNSECFFERGQKGKRGQLLGDFKSAIHACIRGTRDAARLMSGPPMAPPPNGICGESHQRSRQVLQKLVGQRLECRDCNIDSLIWNSREGISFVRISCARHSPGGGGILIRFLRSHGNNEAILIPFKLRSKAYTTNKGGGECALHDHRI